MTLTTSPPPSPPSAGGPRPGPERGRQSVVVAALVAVGGVVLATVAVLASLSGGSSPDADADAAAGGWRGTALAEPRDRPDFTLTDTAGNPYDFRAETGGELTLLFFGYTHCPDVCPIHMATLSAALDRPGMPDPTVVFVTTDPARDTATRLRSFLDQFDTGFVGLRGTPDQIAAAERAAGIAASAVLPGEDTADGDYDVGHAAEIVAYAPDDRARVVYPFGVRREDWIADLPRLATAGGDER